MAKMAPGFSNRGKAADENYADEDFHTTVETKDKMKGRLLLDVVIAEGSAVLWLLASEVLWVWGDAFPVLDLRLDVINDVRRLDLEGDCLAGQCLGKDLHAATKTEDEVDVDSFWML